MSRIRKKIEKRAAQLLIDAKIFNRDDWDDSNLCFYSVDYYGECDEINPWNYLYDLAVDSTIQYVECDIDTGLWLEIGKIEYPSIIEAIRLFKKNYII